MLRNLLWAIAVILIIGWLLGVAGLYSLGYFIHIFLIVAIILILLNIISGRTA
jgi:hypothetical protein